jgi:hypothetical protein
MNEIYGQKVLEYLPVVLSLRKLDSTALHCTYTNVLYQSYFRLGNDVETAYINVCIERVLEVDFIVVCIVILHLTNIVSV